MASEAQTDSKISEASWNNGSRAAVPAPGMVVGAPGGIGVMGIPLVQGLVPSLVPGILSPKVPPELPQNGTESPPEGLHQKNNCVGSGPQTISQNMN
jgi:hypothetical protein